MITWTTRPSSPPFQWFPLLVEWNPHPLPWPSSCLFTHATLAQLSFCSWNVLNSSSSQGLCTCCSHCLKYSSHPSWHSLLYLTSQSSSQRCSSQKGHLWLPNPKWRAPLAIIPLSVTSTALFSSQHVSLVSHSLSSYLLESKTNQNRDFARLVHHSITSNKVNI